MQHPARREGTVARLWRLELGSIEGKGATTTHGWLCTIPGAEKLASSPADAGGTAWLRWMPAAATRSCACPCRVGSGGARGRPEGWWPCPWHPTRAKASAAAAPPRSARAGRHARQRVSLWRVWPAGSQAAWGLDARLAHNRPGMSWRGGADGKRVALIVSQDGASDGAAGGYRSSVRLPPCIVCCEYVWLRRVRSRSSGRASRPAVAIYPAAARLGLTADRAQAGAARL